MSFRSILQPALITVVVVLLCSVGVNVRLTSRVQGQGGEGSGAPPPTAPRPPQQEATKQAAWAEGVGLIADAQLQRTLADALRGYTAEEQVQILERLCEQDCAAAFSTDVEAASCAGCAVRPGLFAFEANSEPPPMKCCVHCLPKKSTAELIYSYWWRRCMPVICPLTGGR